MLGKVYLIIYVILGLLGFTFIDNLISGDKHDMVSFDSNNRNYIVKRIFQLSYIGILLSIYFLTNPTSNAWLSATLVQIVIITFYYIKWGLANKYSYSVHLLLALPVILYPLISNVTYKPINFELPITTLVLLIYYYYIQDKVY